MKTAFFWVIIASFGLCRSEQNLEVNAAGYVFEHNDNVYKIVLQRHDKRSWFEAEEICIEEENGHLISFDNKNEVQWMNKLLTNLTKEMAPIGRFWIGANDRNIRGVYQFIGSAPFQNRLAPWAEGEPNRPRTPHEYCVAMEHAPRQSTWSDNDCFNSYGYICKSKDTPNKLRDLKRFGFKWEWNFHIYKFVPLPYDTMTWSEAELYCKEAEFGHLLSIVDPEESEFITERIKQIRQVIGLRGFWIGATDMFQVGRFRWMDKKPMKYTKWLSGEPTSYSAKPKREREACVTIHTNPHWGTWSDENCILKKPFICKAKMCSGKLDLVFIVDASGSVREEGFLQAKQFMWRVIRGFNVTNNSTRVGLIRYSDFADVIFSLNTYRSPKAIKNAIFKMVFVQGHTKTEQALDLARTKVFTEKGGSRELVPKVAILMTDGKSKRPKWVATAAEKLRAINVNMVAFGIGRGIDMKELTSMASSPDDVLTVASYGELRTKIYDLRERICDQIIAEEKRKLKELEERYRKEDEQARQRRG
ncbi:macrophage mannose receptor 1 isoform X2 [Nematostella vectensis]|uniref:macrophage mannose receptor 1 isoform X2 n=1 Tax=Nematostella vectensis TaxID=45351 RepID=UPI002076ED62|nr:macrophage mannose receptor 1 isoform X2 [Nematostella vectensis]